MPTLGAVVVVEFLGTEKISFPQLARPSRIIRVKILLSAFFMPHLKLKLIGLIGQVANFFRIADQTT